VWHLGSLFGPLLPYDLVRTARRKGMLINRCFYLFALWFILYLVFASSFPQLRNPSNLFAEFEVDRQRLPKLAEHFFLAFVLLQSLALQLVTPPYTAATIATEKANRTLDYLLTTDLTSREIVLGIFGSRFAHLVLLLLAGLPVLSVLQFLGGIDPNLVFIAVLMVGLAALSQGAVGMLVSVYARSPLSAVLFTYFLTLYSVSLTWFGLLFAIAAAGHDRIFLWTVFSGYAAAQLAIAAGALFMAIRNLRKAASQSNVVQTLPKSMLTALPASPRQPVRRRARVRASADDSVRDHQEPELLTFALPNRLPPVTEHALEWKELFAEHRFLDDVRLFAWIFTAIVLAYGGGICLLTILVEPQHALKVTNMFARLFTGGFTLALFFFIALNASTRVTRERERDTLDSLLTTPYEPAEILRIKWLASVQSALWALTILGCVWLATLVVGGLHPVAVPLAGIAIAVFAIQAASLGILCSLLGRTTFRALASTAVLGALLFIGPGPLWNVISGGGFADETSPWSAMLLDQMLSPALNLWVVCFGWDGISFGRLSAAVLSMAGQGLVAYLCWRRARARFEALKGPPPSLRLRSPAAQAILDKSTRDPQTQA
jgi:ABC-type transport system involved in multi-copper enzyme maturation permease subunit